MPFLSPQALSRLRRLASTGARSYRRYSKRRAPKKRAVSRRRVSRTKSAYRRYKNAYTSFDRSNSTRRGKIGQMARRYPVFRFAKDYVEITHREYLRDIYSNPNGGATGQFYLNQFRVNAGDPTTFPWLSQMVSQCFEEYELMGCVFEFRSFSADALNSTDTALGAVIVAVDYDASDEAFQSRQEMENTDDSFSAKPSASFHVPLNCSRKNSPIKTLYMRDGSEEDTIDPKFYDFAMVSIATVGMQANNVNLGSLYVTYKVRVKKIIMNTPGLYQRMFQGRVSAGLATNEPFGTDMQVLFNNMNAIPEISTGLGRLVLNPNYLKVGMKFLIIYASIGSAGAVAAPTVVPPVGSTLPAWFDNYTSNSAFANSTSSSVLNVVFEITATNMLAAANQFIDFTAGTVATADPQAHIYLIQLNGFDWEP